MYMTFTDNMPKMTPRIPQKQLLYEMAALIKEQMSNVMGADMRPMIRSLPKYSPGKIPTTCGVCDQAPTQVQCLLISKAVPFWFKYFIEQFVPQ